MSKVEFVTLISLKVPSGRQPLKLHPIYGKEKTVFLVPNQRTLQRERKDFQIGLEVPPPPPPHFFLLAACFADCQRDVF